MSFLQTTLKISISEDPIEEERTVPLSLLAKTAAEICLKLSELPQSEAQNQNPFLKVSVSFSTEIETRRILNSLRVIERAIDEVLKGTHLSIDPTKRYSQVSTINELQDGWVDYFLIQS